MSAAFTRLQRLQAGRSPVNRADRIDSGQDTRDAARPPGMNAGPSTACGGKPDESG
jgi:hypothetical protein